MWGTVDPEQLAFPLQYARARASGRGHGGGDDSDGGDDDNGSGGGLTQEPS